MFGESEFVTRDEFRRQEEMLTETVRTLAQVSDFLEKNQRMLQGILAMVFDPRVDAIKCHPEVSDIVAELRAGQFEMLDQHFANMRARLDEEDRSEGDSVGN